jgi:hypothetical protein
VVAVAVVDVAHPMGRRPIAQRRLRRTPAGIDGI